MKGLVTRNTHVQCESPITSGLKDMAKVKDFSKVGQTSRSRSQCQKLWYHVKGLVTKGETFTCVNGNVLFFAGKRLQNF